MRHENPDRSKWRSPQPSRWRSRRPERGARYLVTEEHKDGYRILARAETLQSARNFIAIEKHKRQGRKPGSKR